jgi:hypothetical protein
MSISLLLREDPPQTCELSSEEAISTAVRLLAVAKEAAPSDEIVATVAECGWRRTFSVEEACAFGEELCNAIREQEQEARRAAGYSPISEAVEVRRDGKGEIVGMRKQFQY